MSVKDILKAYRARAFLLSKEKIVQFLKFGIVGASNTLISLVVYWLLFYGLRWHYQLSNFVGFIASVVNAHYWNSKYVFAVPPKTKHQSHIATAVKTFISYGGTYLLSMGLLYVEIEILHCRAGIAPVLNLLITVPLNYALHRLWVYRQRA